MSRYLTYGTILNVYFNIWRCEYEQTFIAIEGPIGVGKSSLAHKLSQTLDFYEEKKSSQKIHFYQTFMKISLNGVFKLKCSFYVIDISNFKM